MKKSGELQVIKAGDKAGDEARDSPDVLSGEVYDGGDEVISKEDASDGLPLCGVISKHQADRLHRHFHCPWGVG